MISAWFLFVAGIAQLGLALGKEEAEVHVWVSSFLMVGIGATDLFILK